MFAVVATFTGRTESFADAAGVFAAAAGLTHTSQGLDGASYVLRGKVENEAAVLGALNAVVGMPGIKASASTSFLRDEPIQTPGEAAAIADAAVAESAALAADIPGAGASSELAVDVVGDPLPLAPAAEPDAPPVPVIPDLGVCQPFTVRLRGAGARDLVEQGHAVCAALAGLANFGEPATSWDDGAWCIHGDTPLEAGSLYGIASGAVPGLSVVVSLGSADFDAESADKKAKKDKKAGK